MNQRGGSQNACMRNRAASEAGAITVMLSGITFTADYIIYFKFIDPAANTAANWWLGISPEGIGTIGMLINFITTWLVSRFTPEPPAEVRQLIERIHVPRELEAQR